MRDDDSTKHVHNVHKLYPKLKRKHMHVPIVNTTCLKVFTPKNVLNYIHKLCKDKHNHMFMIHRFLHNLKPNQVKCIFQYIENNNDTKLDTRILRMIKDVLYFKIHYEHEHANKNINTPKNTCIPNLRIKIPFLSKGIELLKLENIINSSKLDKTLPNL